jgi:hypothetical protein
MDADRAIDRCLDIRSTRDLYSAHLHNKKAVGAKSIGPSYAAAGWDKALFRNKSIRSDRPLQGRRLGIVGISIGLLAGGITAQIIYPEHAIKLILGFCTWGVLAAVLMWADTRP